MDAVENATEVYKQTPGQMKWPEGVKSLRCTQCGRLRVNLVPKHGDNLSCVAFWHCEKCKHPNVVDMEA